VLFRSFKSSTLHQWRLKVDDGRQTWHFLETPEQLKQWPQSDIDKYWLGILTSETINKEPESPLESARFGYRFMEKLQTGDGHWAGEYGGPMFLIPGLVITMYVTKSSYPPGFKQELIRYIKNRANPLDGGWGVHIEGVSTVFGTSLNYTSLRLLGVDAEDPVCIKARGTLLKLGGAVGAPSWGKFWLAVLGVYEWDGMNPVPTEPWMLPYFVPIHPARMWIHTRQVYLGMGYIYCDRFKAERTRVTDELKGELYVGNYDEIDWIAQRNNCAEVDLYAPHTMIHDVAFSLLSIYEKMPVFRSAAQKIALEHIQAEDRNTDFADLGPVNKVMNMLVVWMTKGPDSYEFKRHLERNLDFLWMSNDGMRMNGTNGSQLWDTAFVCQALVESGLAREVEFEASVVKALGFMDSMQIKDDMPDHGKFYRHISKGAWPFSTRTQSYTVSDCTAEGLKAVIMLQTKLEYTEKVVSDERMKDAVNVLLSMQNADGGIGSYECTRGPRWLEWLNPAESYPECTTAVLLGLSYFKRQFPDHRSDEIEEVSRRAVEYIKREQKEDGSWFGSWAICFTYATFFALESLSSVGETYWNSTVVHRFVKLVNFYCQNKRQTAVGVKSTRVVRLESG